MMERLASTGRRIEALAGERSRLTLEHERIQAALRRVSEERDQERTRSALQLTELERRLTAAQQVADELLERGFGTAWATRATTACVGCTETGTAGPVGAQIDPQRVSAGDRSPAAAVDSRPVA